VSALYPYQTRVKQLLHEGRSVVLQAPTGSGKTRAALAPFIEAFFDFPDAAFPRQCLYSVPMRVLAGQFMAEYRRDAESYARKHRRVLDVRIQTGERPEDPELMGDLVFATLDQVLSSALGVPYSLSAGRANLNVGAVLGSYLVFDEFHLFPPEAMTATLQLLRVLRRLVPFTLMTATFSATMLEELAHLLDAEPILVDPGEVADIETAWGAMPRKERRFRVIPEVLTAEAVRETHDRRSLVVCNTVDRSVELYDTLVRTGCRPVPFADPSLTPIYERLRRVREADEHEMLVAQAIAHLRERMDKGSDAPWVMLLHSRFERPHRLVKEALLRNLWGRDGVKVRDLPSLIVVATQVVEVGLDISSQVLHTELAPAASVLQRAGRCARYPGEQGWVYVYQVPPKEDGAPNYAPYNTKVETAICERTWEALVERDGTALHFAEEQAVIDAAHSDADRAMLQEMQEKEGQLWDLITAALVFGEASARPRLIRKVDSRTLIVYEAPDEPTTESPYRFEGFSLWHGTLRGKVKALQELAQQLGVPWALRYPTQVEDEEESRIPTAYRWVEVREMDDVGNALLFAVHPCLVAYDAERGFRLAEAGDGAYRSPEAVRRGKPRGEYGYELESYVDHVRRMRRVFEGQHPPFGEPVGGELKRRLAWVARRFGESEGDWHMPTERLEQAVRLVLALHDVGKLEKRWQQWAAKYQEAIGEGKPPFLVVHTHWEPGNPAHENALRKTRRYKPRTHAGEGAMAVARILWEVLDGKTHPGLYRAAITAIARHHSPRVREAGEYELHPNARETVAQALAAIGEEVWSTWAQWLITAQECPNLEARLLPAPPEGHWSWWFVYFTLVRILRLCDGLSQEGM
jgi:CRISPR-associated endonuclease/helicase Cas3